MARRLKDSQKRDLVEGYRSGESTTSLAEEYGCSQNTVIRTVKSILSLDEYHAANGDWIKAQEEDCGFISDYAEEHPTREDISESYLPYFAVRYRSDRISVELKEKIESAIPNRIKYFDSQNFNMYPLSD